MLDADIAEHQAGLDSIHIIKTSAGSAMRFR
jgi:hypothetical protein